MATHRAHGASCDSAAAWPSSVWFWPTASSKHLRAAPPIARRRSQAPIEHRHGLDKRDKLAAPTPHVRPGAGATGRRDAAPGPARGQPRRRGGKQRRAWGYCTICGDAHYSHPDPAVVSVAVVVLPSGRGDRRRHGGDVRRCVEAGGGGELLGATWASAPVGGGRSPAAGCQCAFTYCCLAPPLCSIWANNPPLPSARQGGAIAGGVMPNPSCLQSRWSGLLQATLARESPERRLPSEDFDS